MKSLRIALAVLALGIGIGFAGPLSAKTPNDTLVMANNLDDIITFDPAEVFEIVTGELMANIYDRITTYEPDDLQTLVGGVAESWAISDDGHTITLTIRPGQTFHSGNPLTADDVVFSLRRVIKLEKTPVFLLNQFGWTPDNVDEMVKKTAEMRVELTIPEPLAPSLVLTVLSAGVGSVVDRQTALAHEQDGDMGYAWLKTHSAGSGPYRLVSWKPNESVLLEANPEFRRGAPKLKRIAVRHVPEPAAQRLLLEKGDVDMARNLTTDQLAGLADNSDIKIQTDPKGLLIYLQVSMRDEILSKPPVRAAIKYLIDYQGMAENLLKGNWIVHQSFWPSGFFASLTDNPFSLDVAKAKSLLAEAGYPDGLPEAIEMDIFNVSPFTEIGQSIQATMAEAGIEVKLVAAEKKAVYTKHRARQSQMLLTWWSPDYLDPHSNADAFASNPDNRDEANLTGVIAWRAAWDTPENTALTAQAKQEIDADKRKAIYTELQHDLQADSPFAFLFQSVERNAMRANVEHFISGPSFDLVFFADVTKD